MLRVVVEQVRLSYVAVSKHLGLMAKTLSIWFFIFLLLNYLLNYVTPENVEILFLDIVDPMTGNEVTPLMFEDLPVEFYVILAFLILAYILAYCSIAVNWHRFINLKESAPIFRFSHLEFNYIKKWFSYFLIIIASMILQFVIVIIGVNFLSFATLAYLSGLPNIIYESFLGILLSIIFARLMLSFVEVALDGRNRGLLASFVETKGKTLSIALGVILCALPGFIFDSLVAAYFPMFTINPILAAFIMIIDLILVSIVYCYMSFVYQNVFNRKLI